MKLYGVAIAIVPKKDTPHILGITCTPIFVDDANTETFGILNDLTYKAECDSTDIIDSMNCFAQAVDTIDVVVKLQRESLTANGLPYVPVALDIGEDSRNRVNIDFSYMLLFGEHFLPYLTDEMASETYLTQYLEGCIIKGISYKDMSDEEKMQKRDSTLRYRPFHFEDFLKEQMELRDESKRNSQQAQMLRENYLVEHREFPSEFIEASQKLEKLLSDCTLSRGSFSYIEGGNFEGDNSVASADLEPNDLDKMLIDLKPAFIAGNPEAFIQIEHIARCLGKTCAKSDSIFAERMIFEYVAPLGYADNLEEQERIPSYSFHRWHPKFRQAFYKGYSENYTGPHNVRIKLPLDAPNPPFTDPVFFMILDQLEVAKGMRDQKNVRDKPELRQQLSASARNIFSP